MFHLCSSPIGSQRSEISLIVLHWKAFASFSAGDLFACGDVLWKRMVPWAHEVADGKVTLIDADEVHAEIAQRLRT